MGEFDYDSLGICYWNGSMESFVVGIIGSGPGVKALLDIVFEEDFREFLPDILLAAASHVERESDLVTFGEINVPVYDRFEVMLDRHPEINLVVEMTGSPGMLESLRRRVGESISILDHREVAFFCGLHDMTLVKKYCMDSLAHQRSLLQAILDGIREDILLLDRAGNVVDLNRIVWERAGAQRKDLLGKACWQAARLRDGSSFCSLMDPTCPYHKTLASGRAEEALVTRVSRDGLLQYYRLYAYPIFGVRGEMSHVMVMHRDITKRTLQERHQTQRDKLAIVGEMSTYLAHEIRNPLFVIGGFANSLLKSPDLIGADREKVEIMLEESGRLEHMLTSMLNFARASETRIGEVDMTAVCRDAAELMTIGYGGLGYAVEVRPAGALPAVLGDEDTLKQCVVNILKNGIEAMPGGGTVTMGLSLEGDCVVVRVRDTGVGMDAVDLERVFNPFYSTKQGSSGLGLAMVRKKIDEFGGRVEIASKPGLGTTVSLYLPASTGEGCAGCQVIPSPSS
ncbi:two-component system sensor histidine kinase NtrB [Pseudodesulfovibrio pelocollis]|uniref:two-component system sensor histidine kinase NtrB n=1 Tax=Pseudodesulfovibrio pelocollis TaxID=3051432 RepID=UPI00255A8D3B|nr:ATP-binding protein [Pseudodesulfovibrio sp. SB368]